MSKEIFIPQQQLSSALNEPWPIGAFDLRDGRPEARPEISGVGRIGAVLLLMCVDEKTRFQQIVLTKRRHNLKHHPGQISLPGGQQEPGEVLQMTSLRETHEEIGVPPDCIEIVGKLGQVYIPPSDYTITPFVGWCDAPVEFVKCNHEVEEVLLVDLDTLLKPEALQYGAIVSEPTELKARFFAVGGYQVWGATAVVLNDFIELVRHSLES